LIDRIESAVQGDEGNLWRLQQEHFAASLPSLPLYERPGLAVAASWLKGVHNGAAVPLSWNIENWTAIAH
jgi:hypothetical protein